MCKNVGREGTASLVVIPELVWKISQENQRGARNSPPVGRGLMLCLMGNAMLYQKGHEKMYVNI